MYIPKKYKYLINYLFLTIISIIIIIFVLYSILVAQMQKNYLEKNLEILQQANNVLSLMKNTESAIDTSDSIQQVIYYSLTDSIWGNGSELLVVDDHQNVVFTTNKHMAKKKLETPIFKNPSTEGYYKVNYLNVERIISYSYNHLVGWYLIVLTPTEEVLKQFSYIKTLMKTIIISSIIILSIIVYFVSVRLSASAINLKKKLKEIENGEISLLDQRKIHVKDELWDITLSFNRIVKRYTEMEYQYKLMNNEAKMLALQSQINPHFLHNTLETINSISIVNNVPLISELSRSLSNMFRYNTVNSEKYVTLRDELEHAESYLNVQLIRFDGLIEKQMNVEENILDCKMIKFVLQPIIENSFDHGFRDLMEEGEISIKAFKEDQQICILVEDNGVGMAADETIRINKRLRSDTTLKDDRPSLDKHTGIGIYNVNSRIKLAFGNNYGLSIEERDPSGLTVKIILPYLEGDRENNQSPVGYDF